MTTRRFETGICCFSMRMSSVCHQEIMQSLITFLDIRTSTFLSILYQSYCPFRNLSLPRIRAVCLFLSRSSESRERELKWQRAWLKAAALVSRLAVRRSCAHTLHSLNLKKKRECSQSIHYLIDTTLNTISLYTFQAIRRWITWDTYSLYGCYWRYAEVSVYYYYY